MSRGWTSILAVCLGLSTAVRAAERDGHSTLCAAVLDRKNFLGAENDCRLQRYGPSDVVRCVDRLAQAVGRVDAPLRFVFVGDSRMRQQFYTFIAHWPDYDWTWDGEPLQSRKVQADMEARSALLGVDVAFRWRNVVDDALFGLLERWAEAPEASAPFVAVLGLGAHHFARDGSPQQYVDDLVSIRKRLLRLPAATRVIWMSQPPVIDGKGEKITNHKLQRINDAADAVFRDTGVLIWDSHLPTAEENLRACLENPAASDNQWYRHCDDFIHTGYASLALGQQTLLNFLCGRVVAAAPTDWPVCCR